MGSTALGVTDYPVLDSNGLSEDQETCRLCHQCHNTLGRCHLNVLPCILALLLKAAN